MEDKLITTIVAVIGTISSIIFAYVGYRRGIIQAAALEGKESATIVTDMKYIKGRIDEILNEQKNINITLFTLNERITRVEESSKQAHKRINKLENIKGDG